CIRRDQFTIKKHIPKFLALCSRGRGNVRVKQTLDSTILEHHRSRTENEIRSTFNVTVLIILAAVLCSSVQRVLITQNAAINEYASAPFYVHRHGLANAPCRILNSKVLGN